MKAISNSLGVTVSAALALASGVASARTMLPYCSVIGAAYTNADAVAAGPKAWTTWYTGATAADPAKVCREVLANLYINSGLDPVRMDSGYYDKDGVNTVAIECFDRSQETVDGQGAGALQAAFDRVNQLGKQCILRVVSSH